MSDDDDRRRAPDEHRDALPEDLDAPASSGPYVFPDNNRRRIPGYIYIGHRRCCCDRCG